jgi:hypothetical protein
MAQHVKGEEAEVVFGAEDADVDPCHRDHTRTAEKLVRTVVVELGEPSVKVDTLPSRVLEGRGRGLVLVAAHVEVEIAVRTQAGVRIEPRDRPPLAEDRLDARGAQPRERAGQALLPQDAVKEEEAVGLVELSKRREVRQRRAADPPPGQAGTARLQEERRDRDQILGGDVGIRRPRAPGAREDGGDARAEGAGLSRPFQCSPLRRGSRRSCGWCSSSRERSCFRCCRRPA